jgi:hypothetical protein
MTLARSLLKTVAPIVAGATAGVVVVLFAGARSPGSAAASAPTVATSPRLPPVAVSADSLLLSQRVASLESRMGELSSAPPGVAAPTPAPSHPIEEREERTRLALDEHAKLLLQHSAARRDPAWAARKEEDIGTKLGALAETLGRPFSVEAVDCRSSTCVAKLVWPNEGAARANLRSLLEGSADVSCAREIAFPPGENARSYTASFYLDCAPVAPPG